MSLKLTAPKHQQRSEAAQQYDYELLKLAGHNAAKAAEIVLDAQRGDLFSKQWIEMIRRRVKGPPLREFEALCLRDSRYVVRPKGALGTCGWINGIAWQAVFVTARNAGEALEKARSQAR